jgi:hypothetical protein
MEGVVDYEVDISEDDDDLFEENVDDKDKNNQK